MIKTKGDLTDPPKSLISACLGKIFQESGYLRTCTLPPELGDLLALEFRNNALTKQLDDVECMKFFNKFSHEFIPLRRIDFSDLPINQEFFTKFLSEYRNKLEEICINNCPHVSDIGVDDLMRTIRDNESSLKSLNLGSIPGGLKWYNTFHRREMEASQRNSTLLNGLHLIELTIHNIKLDSDKAQYEINNFYYELITPSMHNSLRHLDLSKCNIGTGDFMTELQVLESLILYDSCMKYPEVIDNICTLRTIRVLDVSQLRLDPADDMAIDMATDNLNLLDKLVVSLPLLTSLDISGTNLVCGKDRHITAFDLRVDKPFEFLGLFHTTNDAAYKTLIPAMAVAGDATEQQLLQACRVYMDRSELLMRALSDLYTLYKSITPSETIEDVDAVLSVILPIINRHLTNEQVMITATAALWCVVKINNSSRNFNDTKVRRIITSQLLDVMHYHRKNRSILINGGLILLFLPDIICEHSRVATIALLMCRDTCPRQKSFGTTLMNALACQVGNEQKINIGNLGTVETMIDIALAKIEEDTCDDTLEIAWSTLWNITDETPRNCKKFLDYKGLEAFKRCMDKFGQNKEVLRNIMGLLGNVAECRNLRKEFMHVEYLERFYLLLSSDIDGIECSYNACGIIAHIVSEGTRFWSKHVADVGLRERIVNKMRYSISKWPVNSKRNINYRSFEPIIRLLDTHVEPEAQYWAVFALANLTRVNPTKYCPMLHLHDGLNKLIQLAQPGVTRQYVQELANLALYQYDRYSTEGTLSGLEQCSSIDMDVVKNFRADPNFADSARDYGEIIL